MGCASSCRTFEIFSTAVEWVTHRKQKMIDHIIHLLDDFLIIAPEKHLCQTQLDLFIGLGTDVGIPIAPEKPCGPLTTLFCEGSELDCVAGGSFAKKIRKCSSLILEFCIGRRSPCGRYNL